MAEFDESKVINALHPEKAEVGKKYWFADSIVYLKSRVEFDLDSVYVLGKIVSGDHPFVAESDSTLRQFLYPYEEPPKKRMTCFQFMEWLAKGNGLCKGQNNYACPSYAEMVEFLDEEVDDDYLIRPFGQTEWIEPTVDIYERDCKGGKE